MASPCCVGLARSDEARGRGPEVVRSKDCGLPLWMVGGPEEGKSQVFALLLCLIGVSELVEGSELGWNSGTVSSLNTRGLNLAGLDGRGETGQLNLHVGPRNVQRGGRSCPALVALI